MHHKESSDSLDYIKTTIDGMRAEQVHGMSTYFIIGFCVFNHTEYRIRTNFQGM